MHRAAVPSALLAIAVAAASFRTAPAQDVEPEHHLVVVAVPDRAGLDRLLAMDLDLAACTALELDARRVEVVATEADLERLAAGGFDFEVSIRRLEQHYADALAPFADPAADSLTPALGQGAMGGHYTLAQMEALLDAMHASHPTLCAEKVSIGTSIEGRDIWMVKISDNVDQDESEPEVYYDALHHAREPVSMEATLLFMDRLLEGYGTDPEATYIVESRELYFVPCVNPDGYQYNFLTNPGGGGLWRKNRRDNGDGSFGVDPNRNYATFWDAPNGGNSSVPSSAIYRGAAPFSEPEAAAVEAFVASRDFVHTCSTHTYTDILLRPWSYDLLDPANAAEYQALGEALTEENEIGHGGTADVLYIVAGGAIDHHHAAHGAYSWSPELGRGDEGGFWPDPVRTVEIAERHQPMFRKLALTAGPHLEIEAIAVSEGAGGNGNGNGVPEPGETGEIVVTLRNTGVADATGPATLTLSSISPGIAPLDGVAAIAGPVRFGAGDNAGDPLTFSIPANFSDLLSQLQLSVDAEGLVSEHPFDVLLAELRTAVDDDMELDRGFERDPADTAVTGGWERAAPQETVYRGEVLQPGAQHTPGGALCWITAADPGVGPGSFDVDGGFTDLLSPVFDLSHLDYAELRTWRWYGESQHDDGFEVFVSDDGGGTWARILNDPDSTGDWIELRHRMPGPLSSQMRFRFRAKDLDPSLVEGGVDDFSLSGVMADGSITLMSSGARGSSIRVGATGAPGSTSHLFLSPALGTTPTIPGIAGTLHLDPAAVIVAGATILDASGYGAREIQIPDRPELAGVEFHWQSVHADGGQFRFSNLQSLTLK